MQQVKTLLRHCLSLTLIGFVLTLVACNSSDNDARNRPLSTNDQDLPGILKRGKLVVLAENSSTSYFIYKGKKMGFEYELLSEFAEDIGVDLEVKIVNDLDEMNTMLNEHEGDIIACNYSITRERQDVIAFSEPFFQTCQVLVQRKPIIDEKTGDVKLGGTPYINDPLQLAGKKIDVRANSSYSDRLLNLQDEIGDTIFMRPTQGHQSAEELIEMVADGQIDYTITEQNVALINEQYYNNIDASVAVSFKQNIAFGLRKDAPLLKKRMDAWLKKFMQRETFTFIKRKYFEQSNQVSSYQDSKYSRKNGGISPFDLILKTEASKYGLDWRFVAAIICHESSFNPNARGFGGAYGLMQFMPGTGPRYGVYPTSTPAVQIKGGIKFIAKINNMWSDIMDVTERNKFILASYNAGSGHVIDAQRLAEKRGLNPHKWEGNVGKMMLNLGRHEYYSDPVVETGALRGTRTYNYVSKIMERYANYKNIAH
jgi:membrane-bound lytic murein transglycosylase F